ncbi:type VI secretion system lipoprotein TssJ [Xenorhabdus anantnagensis]|uniref:Type VI secretion system lipoprotein TssJ n=1 Tax=Xenorhabdus anantnagensis TaxID=3025875 RepID=A0ABT5LQT8_9GAMM|nr:type VI secretion system lipoprotein TssJ [Xenorhabdus anantnagensis]MDC9596163.1 type VI secretion system lipoprotein TssJ [Xenorhabdus anantnagensis]
MSNLKDDLNSIRLWWKGTSLYKALLTTIPAALALTIIVLKIIALAIIAMTAVTGCSSKEKPPPYKLIFDTEPNVNDSAPMKVDVFLLKSNEEFMSADFFSLQDKAKGTLGDKLVNSDLLFIRPSQPTHCLLEKNLPEANYIGLIAEYKNLSGKKWRISFPVPVPEKPSFYEFWRSPSNELHVCIKVTNNGLSLIKECNLSCTAGAKETNE